ncbi:MAG TPA: hypothetical protein VH475_23160 [Tepidisphaeraceae bacterium]
MNLDAARAMLVDLVQPDLPPELTTEELDRLLARVASPGIDDTDGAAYSPAAVYRAAIAGLNMKQARLMHSAITFIGDAGTYTGSQLMDNITTLIREYQRLAGGALLAARPLPPARRDVRVNWNDPYADAP